MKKQTLTLIVVMSVLLAAGSAWAQATGQIVRANIPFSFVVNRQTLPAGQYDITRYSSGANLLIIHGDENGENALVTANSAQSLNPADQTKLVFKRHGDRYLLSEVWVEGSRAGRQLPQSAPKSEVALDSRANPVVVVASLR